MSYGRSGKILFIDLSNKSFFTESTARYKEFIGGRGINQYLLFARTNKGTSPLAPQSSVILGAGTFVGTLVPTADRLAVDFKNVITGGVGSGNCGGHFAAEMKFAGYDHIVISGKSDHPLYLYIVNNKVYFRDASLLWGKDTWETENLIKCLEKDKAIKTLAIGPAGEKQVKFACLIADRGRSVGYGGGGAVFGSKNLKAVAIRGTKPVRIAYPESFIRKLTGFLPKLENSEHVAVHREGGTLLAYIKPGQNRPHGVRNMSDEFWSDQAISRFSRDKFDIHLKRRHSCFNCPVYCSSIYEVNGMHCEGIQANSLRAFGSNLDVCSPEMVLQANALVNLYGLDLDHTSAVIAWAIECFENGILTAKETEDAGLRWGNGPSIIKLIDKIAHRRGFGGLLAEGVYEASRIVGRGSVKYALLVKKNSLMEAAMRSSRAWSLGIITSTKAGGHLRGAPAFEMKRIPVETSRKLLGIDDISDPGSYKNKAQLVTWQENYKGAVDMMGICALMTMWMDLDLFRPEDIADFYTLVTGEDISTDLLFKKGEMLQNIERAFNLLHADFDRKDDLPPAKLVEIPVSDGPYQGERIEPDKWNEMLDEYYACHNWDKQSGRPSKEILEELGLQDISEALVKYKLI